MMKRLIPALGALLLVQIALSAALILRDADQGAFHSDESLLGISRDDIEGIVLQEGDGAPLRIERVDGTWQLPNQWGFPASARRVEKLIDDLEALKRSWPVATTPAAAARFRVASDGFEHRITLQRGSEKLATLYLGTSPGFRKVHARIDGSNEVVGIPFSSFEASAGADDWIDRELLKLQARNIVSLELPWVRLQRQRDTVEVADLEEGEQTNVGEVEVLLNAVANPTYQSVLGRENDPAYRQETPELVVTIGLDSGETVIHTFSKPEGGDHYVLKSSGHPWYFEVGEHTVERIREKSRDRLVQPVEEVEAEPGPEGGEGLSPKAGDTAGN